ncbi:MAG TPA: sensor histidine kinase, partial [Clostridiales bacterium]|nr:sensor histidine kinase [Clostridiales bacterium]
HDLRTPLTSIKGYVSGLIDGIADSPEKRQKYLTTIYNTAEEMDRLVDDLFLFSKLDLDKVPFNFEHVEIGNYISQCCEELKFSLEKKKMCLAYANLCPNPVYVMLDRGQFARVLINIADNSAKYKKNEIGSFYVAVTEDNGEVLIALKDDGEGIDSSLTGKIFDSFYRNDPARTNPVKGSGLGLSIAKQIVTSHGGRIWAESNIGEGLTIYIALPVEEQIIDERKDENGEKEDSDHRG